ncbi:uncharacterized protein LOC105793693 [Gossypium raimondii]|uniref:Uncharacterized protein n=1 Tax=Gossypium raimondii TaxID=29730 RepID=A0A0D2PG45_GOSRA|nr:uncharacterized protein LOC105793693 [Gossypium raimondii]KJB25923.1 hypothetical protein B456_004G216000 [Gossypium raimondii]
MTAAAAVEDTEVVFEEAVSWLPSHVLNEAILETNNQKDVMKYHQYHRHRSKLPTKPFPPSKSRWRGHDQKPRCWATRGGGMQAFFLDTGKRSSGTGVFLPLTQSPGPNNNYFHSTTRPACSPVLLPSRVVQALNLNVHEIGLHISPRRAVKNNSNTTGRGGELKLLNNKNGKNGNGDPSGTNIFLPDEWIY